MPTYDYKCKDCGFKFEKFQKMTEEPLKVCPECGGEAKRLIGAGAGPIFKGSGFYQTDYKNSSKPAEKKTAEKTSSAGETKETKTASPKTDN